MPKKRSKTIPNHVKKCVPYGVIIFEPQQFPLNMHFFFFFFSLWPGVWPGIHIIFWLTNALHCFCSRWNKDELLW